MEGIKMMKKSVGIGSQISQISGIFFPTQMDNFCKIVRKCHYYGRYMDDTYIIHQNKEYLRSVLKDIVRICTELGIHVNETKTQICPLTNFTFLKTKYTLTDTGKIIHRMPRDNITRQRRKLKKLSVKVKEGVLDIKEVKNAYGSWKGNAKWYDSHNTVSNMNALWNDLFIERWTGDVFDKQEEKIRKRKYKKTNTK